MFQPIAFAIRRKLDDDSRLTAGSHTAAQVQPTGHFRLLNQLKADLRKKPLDRDQRTGQLKSMALNRGSSRRVAAPESAIRPSPRGGERAVDQQDDQPKSFRDRLNAIDMPG